MNNRQLQTQWPPPEKIYLDANGARYSLLWKPYTMVDMNNSINERIKLYKEANEKFERTYAKKNM